MDNRAAHHGTRHKAAALVLKKEGKRFKREQKMI
jgi:hypothetical protein